MARTRPTFICTLVAVACAAIAHAQNRSSASEPDTVIGAWQLDLSQSRFSPGPAPAREIRTYEYEHEGIRATIRTTDTGGQEAMVEYVASYNDVVALVT